LRLAARTNHELGRRIAATLPKRAVVLLIGNLGRQTTLAKGIISGLGAAEPGRRAPSR
jgi:tRNA A37 threonylcarbamoyladenosine biosynthesis protein TsaE